MKIKLIWMFVILLLIPSFTSATLTAYYDPVAPDIQTGWGCTGVDCGVGQYEVLNDGDRQGVSTPGTGTDLISKAANQGGISEQSVGTITEGSINYITVWAYVQTGGNFELSLALENNGAEQVSQTYATGLTPQWVSINWTDSPVGVGTVSAVIDGSRNGGGGATTGYVYSWYVEVNYNDSTAPNWSSNTTAPLPPVTYNESTQYQFNVSWTDDIKLHSVIMEHDFNGSLLNYSVTGNTSNIFYYNYNNMSAGNYRWRMFANDTFANWNYTDVFTYTVDKVSSLTNLTLDENYANLSIESGDYVNITAFRLVGESDINLYNNGTLINSGPSPLNNYTRFITPGIHNISVTHPESTNFSSDTTTLYVNVTDTIAPNGIINSISPNPSQFGIQNISIEWQATDLNLDTKFMNVTYPNGTLLGTFYGNTTLNISTDLNVLGFYNVTIFANDSSGNFDIDSQLFEVRDTFSPSYSNILETPTEPVNFSEGQIYEFNITWFDYHGIANVWLVFDGVAYYDASNESNVFKKTFSTLNASTHSYRWYANDSSGNTANTPIQTYVVGRAPSEVNLTLNGVKGNLTVNAGTFVEINATTINPAVGFLEIYKAGTLIQSGNNLVSNYSLHSPGFYNITALYSQTQNYSSSYLTYYLRVNALPISTLDSPPPGHTDIDGNFSLVCTGTDSEGLSAITLYHNISQPYGPNQTIYVNGTLRTIEFNLTNIPDGNYQWNCLVNDTYNARDFSNNRTIFINSSANQPPIPEQISPYDFYHDNDGDIDFNCSATDFELLQNISFWWNVGGTFERNETVNVGGTENSSVFTKTNIPEGIYLWACEAADPFGNIVITNNRTFVVDTTAPWIDLNLPKNNSNFTITSVLFNYTFYDNSETNTTCNISINGTILNSSIAYNNTPFVTTISGLGDGINYWNVSCADEANNVNSSLTWIYNIYTVGRPINLSIVLAEDNFSRIINWSDEAKADYYNIYFSNNLSKGFDSTPNITGITDTNYTDSESTTKRFYRLSAVNDIAENFSNYDVGKIGPENLVSGFNLISHPFNISNFELNNGTNSGYKFKTSNDCINALYRWNGSLFEQTANEGNQIYQTAIGSENFTRLDYGMSYWINTNSQCNITYLGVVPNANFSKNLTTPFYLGGWYSGRTAKIDETAIYGNPVVSSPAERILRVYRYNSSSGLFEGVRYFNSYGWWQMADSPEFTTLNPGRGYYFSLTPTTNWIHNPEFGND